MMQCQAQCTTSVAQAALSLVDDIFGDQANTAYVVTTKTKKG
jgi:hypothetical protein